MRLQLSKAPIVLSLFVATCAIGARADDDLTLSLDTLGYADTDNVMTLSPQAGARYSLDAEGGNVTARFGVDMVSAASVDVVSHATNGFREMRYEGDVSVAKAFGDQLPSLSYRISVEPDYVSHSGHAGLTTRLGSPDTVASVGYSLTYDTIGRSDTSFATLGEHLTTHAMEAGITQTLSTRALVRVVYTLTYQDGFMEKPYRFVPLFDAAGIAAARADGATLDLDTFDRYRLPVRPPEEVPDQRARHAFGARFMYFVPDFETSLRVDYQLYLDSFGVMAHTVEAASDTALTDELRLALYARLYGQGEADFWQRTYVVDSAQSIPRYRSADRDYSSYWTISGGARGEVALDDRTRLYVDFSVASTQLPDFLYLDHLLALVAMSGVRWTP